MITFGGILLAMPTTTRPGGQLRAWEDLSLFKISVLGPRTAPCHTLYSLEANAFGGRVFLATPMTTRPDRWEWAERGFWNRMKSRRFIGSVYYGTRVLTISFRHIK